jgi:hypothetical protein
VSAASKAFHEARSNASHTNSGRHNRHGSRVNNLEHADRRNLSINLDSSFLPINERGNIMPKTPKAALVAAQAYLYTTQPTPRDPREHMHRATLQGLRLLGNKLTAREEEPRCHEGTHKPRSPRCHNSPRHRGRSRRSMSPSPKHYNSPQHQRTQRSKPPNMHMTMKTTKRIWGCHALLTEFAEPPYPKNLNYPMISRNTTGPRSRDHGSQTTCK